MSDQIDVFLSEVVKKNTNPDGSEKDPRLLARMDNPICRECHALYKAKYPGEVFRLKCSGIYDEIDYKAFQENDAKENPDSPMELDDIREIYDVAFWATRYIKVKDENGDMQPFVARDYQVPVLRCTATRKIDRMGRGLGKTSLGVIEELHKVMTHKNYDTLVLCPAEAQSEKWYEEIRLQLENSPSLDSCVAQKKQQPFKLIRLWNGSTISIFTAGSSSGRGANSIRSQSPRRTRLEEQDYLAEKDYQAVMPLLRRYKNSEFHGSSTPTGARSTYWQMCTKLPEYREFFYSITVHPDWGPEMEENCIKEAKTMDRYRHEFLAEFGDPEAGVFKGIFVDRARKEYTYGTCKYNPACSYHMGVDWNGKGTGTRIRVTEFDPATKIRRCVDKATIDDANSTTVMSMQAVISLNKKWHCEQVFIDKGFGFAQDELLRLAGYNAAIDDSDTARLKNITTIGFKETLKTNRLIPKRDASNKYISPDDEQLERSTKPFMVEGAVMAFEADYVEVSMYDDVLDEQLRAYRVKTWTQNGSANTYEADASTGDHDLDAFMLSLLAIELKYGLFHTPDVLKRLASVVHVSGWGIPSVQGFQVTDDRPVSTTQQRMEKAGVNQRGLPATDPYKIQAIRGGAIVIPNRIVSTPGSGIGSRTSIFRSRPFRSPFGRK